MSNVIRLPVRSQTKSAPQEAQARIAALLEGGDLAGAAALAAAARAEGTLALRHDIELGASLLPLLTSRGVPAAQARAAASSMGWLDEAGQVPGGPAFDRLRARLAAERWLDEVREAAARRNPFDARTAAARRLTGRRPSLLRQLLRPRAELARLLAELEPHREWVENRLDPAGLDEARRSVPPAP